MDVITSGRMVAVALQFVSELWSINEHGLWVESQSSNAAQIRLLVRLQKHVGEFFSVLLTGIFAGN